jgi:3-hydroxyisobutyrate dehydrogenase-like beta-hydroxyacid dehydrogenase
MNIGFIGLGVMGGGMAAHLLEAGFKLTVHDIRRAAARPLLEAGAAWAETPAALTRASEIIFTCLPAPRDVEDVALGADGILAGISPGKVLIDSSTNSPAVVQRLYAIFKEKGAHVMDAPIGERSGSKSGKLMLMVSGDEDVFQRCKPVLDAVGDRLWYFGKIGNGSICKIVQNCLSFGVQAVVAEGFTLGLKAGMEPEMLWRAISQAAVGQGALFHVLGPNTYLPRHFDPPQFALKLAFKDVALAASLGREYNVPMPLTSLTLQDLMYAMNRGWGDRDATVAMVLQEERAGVEVPAPADNQTQIEPPH